MMIHRPEYVKELLRKYLEGTATPIELARWAAARHIYTDEEIIDMTAEIFKEVKDMVTATEIAEQSTLLGSTYTKAIKTHDVRNNWWVRNRSVAIITGVIIATGMFLAIWKNVNERMYTTDCPGVNLNENIPTSVFYCELAIGKDSLLKIDSNSKGVLMRSGNIVVRQNQPGILQFETATFSPSVDTSNVSPLQVSTRPGQQYLVLLPDGSRIRLNASSFIRLPVLSHDPDHSSVIELSGEAYIETIARHDKPLKIQTANAIVSTSNAVFNIRASSRFTSAIVIKGQFHLRNPAGKNITLYCPGDKGYLVEFNHSEGVHRDTMAVVKSQDVDQELMWMKTARVYDHAPLRQFASDMSRWYGFTIKNLNCIPENIRISTSICYQASLQEVFAVFRNAGLTVYEEKDVISFCDPVQNRDRPNAKNLTASVY